MFHTARYSVSLGECEKSRWLFALARDVKDVAVCTTLNQLCFCVRNSTEYEYLLDHIFFTLFLLSNSRLVIVL